MTSRSSRNSSGGGGYHYDPVTGTYIPTHRHPSHPPPPPLPPKELEAGYITKETQHEFVELEGDLDIGALSIDEKPSSGSSATPRKSEKSKRPVPRQKRKLRILSLGTYYPCSRESVR